MAILSTSESTALDKTFRCVKMVHFNKKQTNKQANKQTNKTQKQKHNKKTPQNLGSVNLKSVTYAQPICLTLKVSSKLNNRVRVNLLD